MTQVRELATFRFQPPLHSGVREMGRMGAQVVFGIFNMASSAQPT
jgi:hypothetical protein